MRRVLLIAPLLLAGCGEWHSSGTHFEPVGTSSSTGGDGGISFQVIDGGGSSGSTGTGGATTGTSGTAGTTGQGGSTGLSTGTSGTTGGSTTGGQVDAGPPDAGFIDRDQDGLDDRTEAALARDYLPFLSFSASDGCPVSGLVYRARPHPQNPSDVVLTYVALFQKDCPQFANPQIGDTEAFALTIDPSQPPPQGILAARAISHRGSSCAKNTACTPHTPSGACASLASCDLDTVRGTQRPVLYVSASKHGVYLTSSDCSLACLESCTLASSPTLPPMENAGEPGAPLTDDLTDAGFVNFANGWTETSLYHYDPWNPDAGFGGGPAAAVDLDDPALEPPICP